jgi:hypothetical protein
VPVRNPQFQGALDPDTMTTGFHRSIVAAWDMRTTDVVAGAAAAPTTASPDGIAPVLWSVDGPRTLSPNFDGVADGLNLLARWSETVSWTAEIRNAADQLVRSVITRTPCTRRTSQATPLSMARGRSPSRTSRRRTRASWHSWRPRR